MKIVKISIKNFRRFHDVSLNLSDDLTILAGANNSGKTSLIHLLNYIFLGEGSLGYKDVSVHETSMFVGHLFRIIEAETNFQKIHECLYKSFFPIANEDSVEDDITYPQINNISVCIEVVYEEKETIAKYADYLMNLDSDNRSFYFMFELTPAKALFSTQLETDRTTLVETWDKYQKSKKDTALEEDSGKSKVNRNKQIFINQILSIYGNSLKGNYYYTDLNFENRQVIEINDFRRLFNYDYIVANRQLKDKKGDKSTSLVTSVMKVLDTSKDNNQKEPWAKQLEILSGEIETLLLDSDVDKLLLESTQKTLESIKSNLDNAGETHIDELALLLDYSKDSLGNTLKRNIHVNYAFNDGEHEQIMLAEDSQGLGISNLIYITLEIIRFWNNFNPSIVNLFVIEEPESHMHIQMQRALIYYLESEFTNEEKQSVVQGLITSHSCEIVKVSRLDNIRAIRPKSPYINKICDLSDFLARVAKDDKKFYETFFSINFSNMIFADKMIIYEGDTERMYIESLLNNRKTENGDLKELSRKYITYAQAGGANAHKYKELLDELEIQTLILSDIDYEKDCSGVDDCLTSKTSNKCIEFFYDLDNPKDLPDEELDTKEENDEEPLRISDILIWQKKITNPEISKSMSILCKSQTKHDGYARTLEEALLFKYVQKNYGIENLTVFTQQSRKFWEDLKTASEFEFPIPNRTKEERDSNIELENMEISIRRIVKSISNSGKSDFMYSIIMADQQELILPQYMQEGLKWLNQK